MATLHPALPAGRLGTRVAPEFPSSPGVDFGDPVRLVGDPDPEGGNEMQYMLLIHQGTTPTPADPEAWARLSEDE